jgi:hypothetical protein
MMFQVNHFAEGCVEAAEKVRPITTQKPYCCRQKDLSSQPIIIEHALHANPTGSHLLYMQCDMGFSVATESVKYLNLFMSL